jgi:hypothetical protein
VVEAACKLLRNLAVLADFLSGIRHLMASTGMWHDPTLDCQIDSFAAVSIMPAHESGQAGEQSLPRGMV